jgi:hypothetical protein
MRLEGRQFNARAIVAALAVVLALWSPARARQQHHD